MSASICVACDIDLTDSTFLLSDPASSYGVQTGGRRSPPDDTEQRRRTRPRPPLPEEAEEPRQQRRRGTPPPLIILRNIDAAQDTLPLTHIRRSPTVTPPSHAFSALSSLALDELYVLEREEAHRRAEYQVRHTEALRRLELASRLALSRSDHQPNLSHRSKSAHVSPVSTPGPFYNHGGGGYMGAVDNLYGVVEQDGFNVNGFVANLTARGKLRSARNVQGDKTDPGRISDSRSGHVRQTPGLSSVPRILHLWRATDKGPPSPQRFIFFSFPFSRAGRTRERKKKKTWLCSSPQNFQLRGSTKGNKKTTCLWIMDDGTKCVVLFREPELRA